MSRWSSQPFLRLIVGFGSPFAGVLALVITTSASLGKMFSEAVENIDPGPIEAITATGANRAQVVLYGVVPQIIPDFLSYTIYHWDINVRISTIIGFVGGGGIGYYISQHINSFEYHKVGTAIIAIVIVVWVLDFLSSQVRKQLAYLQEAGEEPPGSLPRAAEPRSLPPARPNRAEHHPSERRTGLRWPCRPRQPSAILSRNRGARMNGLVLVLNANFEPLHVCDTHRALNLIVGGKARLVANGRGYVRTVRLSYPRPSVIQLHKMIHRPHPRVRLSKREVFRRDEFTCQYCGRQTAHLTIDHVVPRHRGGTHTWANLVAACPACNRRKGGRTIEEAHMQLHRLPHEPPATARYLFGRHLEENREWLDFLEGW